MENSREVKMKKVLTLSVLILIVFIITDYSVYAEEKTLAEENNELKAKIKELETTVIQLQEKIKDLESKIESGNKKKQNVTIKSKTKKITSNKTGYIYYSHKEEYKSKFWFEKTYEQLKNMIAYVDGEYISSDICKSVPYPNRSKVLSVMGYGEILLRIDMRHPRMDDQTWHIYGLNREFINGEKFGGLVKETGVYTYETVIGAKNVVRSFVAAKLLSKEEFEYAIENGLDLTRYQEIAREQELQEKREERQRKLEERKNKKRSRAYDDWMRPTSPSRVTPPRTSRRRR